MGFGGSRPVVAIQAPISAPLERTVGFPLPHLEGRPQADCQLRTPNSSAASFQ